MEHDFDECDFSECNVSYHYYHPSVTKNFGKHTIFNIDVHEEKKKYLIEFYRGGCKRFQVDFCDGEWYMCTSAVFRLEVKVKDGRPQYTEVITSSKEGKTTNHKCAYIDKKSKFQLFIRITAKTSYEVTIDKNPPIVYEMEEKNNIFNIHIYGAISVCSFHEYKIQRPEVIYLRIPDFAQIGDIFTFRGKAPKNGKRFAINFRSEEEDLDNMWRDDFVNDILFRFCAYFGYEGKNYIACNTSINKKWQTEINDKGMPLKAEQPYKFDILVEREHIQCWVNDVEFCTYKHVHPISFKTIQDIAIGIDFGSGDHGIRSVVMTRVNRKVSRSFGFRNAGKIAKSDPKSVIYFPSIPAKINFPFTFEPGSCISISGVFKRAAQKFKCVIEGEKGNIIYEMEADFSKRTITPFKHYDGPDKSSDVGAKSANQPIKPAKVTDGNPSASVAEAHSQVMHASTPLENKPKKNKLSAAPPFPFKANGHFDMLILVCDGLFNFFVDDKIFYRCQPNDNYRLAKFILFSGDVKVKIVYFVKLAPLWVNRLTDKLPTKGNMYYKS